MRHRNKIWSKYHILHSFSSAKFRNAKIKLRKFLNDHHIILNVYCFTMYYVQNHGTEPKLLTLWIFRFNPWNLSFQPSESFVSIVCTSCLEMQSPSLPLNWNQKIYNFWTFECKYDMTLMVHTKAKYISNILIWPLFITEYVLPGLAC